MTIDRTEAHRQLNKLCPDFHVTGRRQRQPQYTSSLLGRVTSAWQGLLYTLNRHSHILGLLQWPRIVMLIIIALANTVTYIIIFTILFPVVSRNQVANPPPPCAATIHRMGIIIPIALPTRRGGVVGLLSLWLLVVVVCASLQNHGCATYYTRRQIKSICDY